MLTVLMMFFSGISLFGQGEREIPGEYSPSGFVEFLPGSLPLIISVPHDGERAPDYLPDRTCEGAQTKTDLSTRELGYQIQKAFLLKYGKSPYLVVNHLRRRKVDVNRDIDKAACGNPVAMKVWNEYHALIDSASALVQKQFGKGLYIDLHAHGHKEQVLEIGYLLDAEELQLEDEDLNADFFPEKSSVRNLAAALPKGTEFAKMLRGSQSLGSLFEKRGYPAIPSRQHPAPGLNQPFFRGGFSIAAHGSMAGGTIDGIQLETNSEKVRDSQGNIIRFAGAFADIIAEYLHCYYKYSLGEVQQNAK